MKFPVSSQSCVSYPLSIIIDNFQPKLKIVGRVQLNYFWYTPLNLPYYLATCHLLGWKILSLAYKVHAISSRHLSANGRQLALNQLRESERSEKKTLQTSLDKSTLQ